MENVPLSFEIDYDFAHSAMSYKLYVVVRKQGQASRRYSYGAANGR